MSPFLFQVLDGPHGTSECSCVSAVLESTVIWASTSPESNLSIWTSGHLNKYRYVDMTPSTRKTPSRQHDNLRKIVTRLGFIYRNVTRSTTQIIVRQNNQEHEDTNAWGESWVGAVVSLLSSCLLYVYIYHISSLIINLLPLYNTAKRNTSIFIATWLKIICMTPTVNSHTAMY